MAQLKHPIENNGLGKVFSTKRVKTIGFFAALLVCASLYLGAQSARGSSFELEQRQESESSIEAELQAAAEEDPVLLVVDVAGAVNNPGVYELKDGSRVAAAIDAAGGLAPEADVSGINRASKLVDGQKIYIPLAGESSAASGAANSASTDANASSGLVNINTASLEELDALPGVGPSTAQAIIDDRTQNGAFASIEDLLRVSGIGEKKYEKLKASICV